MYYSYDETISTVDELLEQCATQPWFFLLPNATAIASFSRLVISVLEKSDPDLMRLVGPEDSPMLIENLLDSLLYLSSQEQYPIDDANRKIILGTFLQQGHPGLVNVIINVLRAVRDLKTLSKNSIEYSIKELLALPSTAPCLLKKSSGVALPALFDQSFNLLLLMRVVCFCCCHFAHVCARMQH